MNTRGNGYPEGVCQDGECASSTSVLWSKRLELGIERLDQEHRELVAGFSGLLLMLKQRASGEVVRQRFQHCFDLLLEHLRYEEELMVRYHYPRYNQHIMATSDLVKSVFEIGRRLDGQRSSGQLQGRIELAIQEGLFRHIDQVDRPLADYLRLRGMV
ncbi:bacteriohemerythrin [Aestuariirhabdus litorea]|nr:hemerythrin domain-containing protein [Aestuariirhabdus litorea]